MAAGTERMDTLLSTPIQDKYDAPLKLAAKRQGRSVAGHVRWLILQDLMNQGLVDSNLEPIGVPVDGE